MSGNPDNAQSAGAAESSSSRGQGSRSQGRRKGKRSNSSKRPSELKGKREEVKDCVCEISSSGSDSFTKTNREVAERVGRAITGAGELRAAAVDLRAGGELEPAPPGDPSAPDFAVRVETWREDRKAWARRAENRLKVKQQIFPAALGQRDPAARPRVEAAADWDDVNANNDVIGMLRLIRSCEVQRQARRDEASALLGSERRLVTFRQSNLASSERCQSLKDKVEAADQLGAAAGEKPDLISARLNSAAADPDLPAEAERQAATAAAKEERPSRLLLSSSDKKRRAGLVRDIENERARGANSCPETLSGARGCVVSCVAPRAPSRHSDEGGVARAQERVSADAEQELQDSRPSQQGGQGGGGDSSRGGRGGGRGGRGGHGGRGGRQGGRGRGRDNDRQVGFEPQSGNAHNQGASQDPDNSDAQLLLDNLDEPGDCCSLPSSIDHVVATAAAKNKHDVSKMLVLDSASTLNVACDENLLRDAREAPAGVKARCSAGQVAIRRQGYLGDFPEPAWLRQNGIVNILSFCVVQRRCHAQRDNRVKDALMVAGPSGAKTPLKPIGKGLRARGAAAGDAPTDAWAFIFAALGEPQRIPRRRARTHRQPTRPTRGEQDHQRKTARRLVAR